MVYGKCPNCERDIEVDEYEDCALSKTHLVPLFLPIFKECICGEKYTIDTDCDYDDAVLVLNFYLYGITKQKDAS